MMMWKRVIRIPRHERRRCAFGRGATPRLDASSERARDAVAEAPPASGFKHFLFTHKGGVTLTFSALVYVVAWAMLRFTTWHTSGELIANISEAALIGGLCDYIALRMIFERKWYLPGSGVLPRNREKLINGIAIDH